MIAKLLPLPINNILALDHRVEELSSRVDILIFIISLLFLGLDKYFYLE